MDSLVSAASIAVPIPCVRKTSPPPMLGSPDSNPGFPHQNRPRSGTTDSVSSISSANGLGTTKRQKVSRACDECRRKKIRCDIEAVQGTCSSCYRASIPCTFSRVQLKRGPSKRLRSRSDVSGGRPTLAKENQLPSITSLLRRQHSPISNHQNMSPSLNSQNHQQMSTHLRQSPDLGPKFGSPNTVGLHNGTHTMHSPPLSADLWNGNPNVTDSPDVRISHLNLNGSKSNTPVAASGSESRRSSMPIPHQFMHQQQQQQQQQQFMPVNSPVPISLYNPQQTQANTAWQKPMSFPGQPNQAQMPYFAFQEINHHALNTYYQVCHPIFPILPDSPAQLQPLLAVSPAARLLVAAINGQTIMLPIESVPSNSSSGKISQLMALMLIYLQTLDYIWLGAVVAGAMSMKDEFADPEKCRLFHIANLLDSLHSVSHKTPKLIESNVAEKSSVGSENLLAMQRYLQPQPSSTPPPEPPTEPVAMALQCLGNLSDPQAKQQLSVLLPSLNETPLVGFISKALS